jgi:SNF2 family DNA or RNA helicase
MQDTQATAGGELLAADLRYAIEAEAAGDATAAELALLEGNRALWRAGLQALVHENQAHLTSIRSRLTGDERDQVLADFERERADLLAALRRLDNASRDQTDRSLDGPGEIRLQASWSGDQVVVWAAGPGTAPASGDELSDRLEEIGAPAEGWDPHPPVSLPSQERAQALSIRVADALGWLVAVGARERQEGIGASVTWLGRVAVWAVRLAVRGAIVPVLHDLGRSPGGQKYSVRWVPALIERPELDRLAGAMPGPAGALDDRDERTVTVAILSAMVDAIANGAARRLELPAPPPHVRTSADVAEAVITRLDGSEFIAPNRSGASQASHLERWSAAVRDPVDARLVVQLSPPDRERAWFLSVLGPGHNGQLVPLEVALVDGRSKRHLADEIVRLERLLPVLNRAGGSRRGEVVLSQDEAWELMTQTGPALETAGFEVRVPALSLRRPRPSLRLTTDPVDSSVVGAHQLVNVRWSAVFDDVELSAAEIRRLAAEAKPLVRSRGRWVELDRADLTEAAAALAERDKQKQLTGGEVLRHAIGLEHSPLAGGTTIAGGGWAADLLDKASRSKMEPVEAPPGFSGTLRAYQAEALAWLGFLDGVELGGCLALDMGLGKTPTLLAHIARTSADGPTLVIAPAAVVGNWAAEAARFTPGLRVVVHHGASRASEEEFSSEAGGADIVVTTYGTAVRDVDVLAAQQWGRIVVDEAQAIKNPASETAQLLRRIPAASRVALTGTPVENGLGDLWAILDFANPGLLGPRNAFVSQLSAESRNGKLSAESRNGKLSAESRNGKLSAESHSGRRAANGDGDGSDGEADGKARAPADSRQRGEHALQALNGILVFRRTKAEPDVAAELPDKIDELDHCTMTEEQIGLYQAVLERLVNSDADERRQGDILAAITALKQICNHPSAYTGDEGPLAGRSGKLSRLDEIVDSVFAAGEKVLVFTHFAEWGLRLAEHISARSGIAVSCYHGGLARGARDRLVAEFQQAEGPGALVLSLKAGGTGLNLTAASHVVLYDRWWNPAVEDQARDRAWRIGQTQTVVSHRLVCPGTVDERIEEVVAGKRHIAELVLPKSSSLSDLGADQLRVALGLRPESMLTEDAASAAPDGKEAA